MGIFYSIEQPPAAADGDNLNSTGSDANAAATAASSTGADASNEAPSLVQSLSKVMNPYSAIEDMRADPNAKRIYDNLHQGDADQQQGDVLDPRMDVPVEESTGNTNTIDDDGFTDPVDVVMSRIAPPSIVRMLSGTSSQPEPARADASSDAPSQTVRTTTTTEEAVEATGNTSFSIGEEGSETLSENV